VIDFSFLFARYAVRSSGFDGSAGEGDVEMTSEFRDGLRGSGQPIDNRVTFHGNTIRPSTVPLPRRNIGEDATSL
jgi:hypothetical protein